MDVDQFALDISIKISITIDLKKEKIKKELGINKNIVSDLFKVQYDVIFFIQDANQI